MDLLSPLLKAIDFVKAGFGKIKGVATDNPVTRFVAGSSSAPQSASGTSGYSVPAATTSSKQRVDAGGTLRIKIDNEGRARVTEARPNDKRMNITADTGLLMGAM